VRVCGSSRAVAAVCSELLAVLEVVKVPSFVAKFAEIILSAV
jgi:hypothetical protein